MRFPLPLALLLCSFQTSSTLAFAEEADYTAAVDQELARLEMKASCDPDSRVCTVTDEKPAPETTLEAKVIVSPKTATVYAYIDPFIQLEDAAGPDLALARRMLSLNREMITCKLEWNKTSSSVRLSTVLSTDSNFDRKAFRSQLLGLFSTARTILQILSPGPASKPQGDPSGE